MGLSLGKISFKGNVDFFLLCLIYLVINSLFIIKYLGRLTSYYYVGVVGYAVLFVGMMFAFDRFSFWSSKYLYAFLVAIALVGILLLQHLIDPYLVQVDRWSAIHNFLSNLLDGQYPYAAQTHCGGYGSPFPMWQLFHLPFYLLGNVGYSIIFILFVFAWVTVKAFGWSAASKMWLLIVMAPSFWYEVGVRSDLIGNFILCLSVICWLCYKNVSLSQHVFLWSAVCAAFLSTRLSTAIPFALLLFPAFLKLPWKKQVGFVLGVVGLFVLTFLPFALWNGNMLLFFEYSPLALQTRQGTWQDYVIMLPLGIVFACTWGGNFVRWLSHTSYTLFLLVVVTFFFLALHYCTPSFGFDIAYFNMVLPFSAVAIICWHDNRSLVCRH